MSALSPRDEPVRAPFPRLDPSGARPAAVLARIERWGLLAGVTGCVANALLVALWAVAIPGDARYEWTGPANDVMGAVSVAAAVPLAWALLDHLGHPPRLARLTRVAVAAMVVTVALSLLLVVGVIPFPVQGAGAVACLVAIFAWLWSVGHAARSTGRLPGGLARAARAIAAAFLAAVPLAGVAVVLPRDSVAQLATGGAAVLLCAGAYLAYPVWQLVLAARIGRLAVPRA